MKAWLKTVLFGPAGVYTIRRGLLKGLRFHVDPRGKSQRLLGLDEREIVSIIRTFAGRARTAVDVGANDGWYTLFFASVPNLDRVLACDPDPDAFMQLKTNIELNPEALGRKIDTLPCYIGESAAEGTRTLDEILTPHTPPYLIKIDVDGAELDVLRGGKSVLARPDTMLVVETHTAELERDCLSYLNSLGYTCRVIPNAWYRILVPELRPIPHNRWFAAEKRPDDEEARRSRA